MLNFNPPKVRDKPLPSKGWILSAMAKEFNPQLPPIVKTELHERVNSKFTPKVKG